MPKYTNNSSNDYFVEGIKLDAGAIVLDEKIIQQVPSNVSVDLTTGMHDPIILSQKVTGAGTVTIPATSSGYKIEVYCPASAEATFKLNASGTAVTVGAGDKFVRVYRTRLVGSIVFSAVTSAAHVTITKE